MTTTNPIGSSPNHQLELEILAARERAELQTEKPKANKATCPPTWTQEPMQSRAPTFSAAALRSEPGEEKVKAALEGINSVARELSGHGVDVNGLAQQFSSSRYAGTSAASVQSLARQAFITEALKARPELADKISTMLMRGMPESMRATVLAGVPQPASGTPSVADAIQRVRTERAEARGLMDTVNAENRKIVTVSRPSELSTGVLLGTSVPHALLGGTLVQEHGQVHHTGVETANRAGQLMAGELTQKQAQVRQAYGVFVQTYGRYTEANAQYQGALERRDYQAISELDRRCQDLVGQLRAGASEFMWRSKDAQRAEHHFEEAVREGLVHAAVSAASMGMSSTIASSAKSALGAHHGHLAHQVGEVAGLVVEGVVTRVIAEAWEDAEKKKH